MAISIVQSAKGSVPFNNSLVTATFGSNVTAGNSILVVAYGNGSGGFGIVDFTLTDTLSGITSDYTRDSAFNQSFGGGIVLFLSRSAVASGGSCTVSMQWIPVSGQSIVNNCDIIVLEVSGPITSLGVQNFQSTNSSPGSTIGTGNANSLSTGIGPLLVLAAALDATRQTVAWTATNGTIQQNAANTQGHTVAVSTFGEALSDSQPFSETFGGVTAGDFAFAAIQVYSAPAVPPETCPVAWLSIHEPDDGWTDQSHYLHVSESITFSWIARQRGTAKIPLVISGDDDYMPTIGSQVCLWDITEDAEYEVFSGTIDDFEVKWLGINGDRIVTLTCVSLEQVFDTIRLPSLRFVDQTAGDIFTALFAYADGSPVTLGTVDAGVTIADFVVANFPSIAEMFTRLATESQFVWGVDPGTGELYFHAPETTPSPFTLDSEAVLWEQMTLKEERHDYRNNQRLQPNSNAAVLSKELFAGSAQSSFTMLRPVEQITNAWLTQNVQNFATGTFTGQPSVGDVISFKTPGSGSTYNWSAGGTYAVGAIIIDSNGFIQKVTTSVGVTGGTEPDWIEIYGQITQDNLVQWQNQGRSGFQNGDLADYTFVDSLDGYYGAGGLWPITAANPTGKIPANAQFGLVLIGATLADTIQNLVDAINAIQDLAGITFSLATWENPVVNADTPAGATTFIVRNKAAEASYITALDKVCANFSWSSPVTEGGLTTFGTVVITFGIDGQTTGGSVFTIVYNPGSNIIKSATPLQPGNYLQIEYLASNAGFVQVEDTGQVLERAAIEGGTGKYQQTSSDDSATSLPVALQLAQGQLAAFVVIPKTFEFTTMRAGLYVGQVLDIDLVNPHGANSELGGGSGESSGTYTTTQILTGGGEAIGVCYDGAGHVWNCDLTANAVYKYDVATMALLDTITLTNPTMCCFDSGTGTVWVRYGVAGDQVAKIDPVADTVIGSYTIGSAGGQTGQITSDGTRIWCCNSNDDTVSVLLAVDGSLVATVSVGNSPNGVCFDRIASVWVANQFGASVTKITAATQAVVGTYTTGVGPFSVESDGVDLWLTDAGYSPTFLQSLERIDIATGAVLNTYPLGDDGTLDTFFGLAWDQSTGILWMCDGGGNAEHNFIYAIDVSNGTIIATYDGYANGETLFICIAGTSIWASNGNLGALTVLKSDTPPADTFWFIQEIQAEVVPVYGEDGASDRWLPGGGHFRYTVTCINVAQIGSWIDFWLGLGGGGSSSSVSGGGGALGASGNATAVGGVNEQTADYTALDVDNGRIISMHSTSSPVVSLTLTLPAFPPSTTWNIFVQNTGGTNLDVDPNGLELDGVAAVLTLAPGTGVYVSTDGINYFTSRGVGSGGGGSVGVYAQAFVAVTTVTVTHGLGSTSVIAAVYDGSGNQVIPANLQVVDANTVQVDFGVAQSGTVVIIGG